MSISTPFIKRPIATSLLAFFIAVLGIFAFRSLPVSQLPQIEFPTIMVQASMPGASPEIMATSIATPIERRIGRIANISEMTSSSSLGTTRITVQFDLSRDINGAARDIQAAINASLGDLPTNLPFAPTYRMVNPADAPIMIFALTSDIYSKGEMYDAASTILQQKISQVEGVGQVSLGGSSLPAIRVELNPMALNQYGIGLNTVRAILSSANINRPKGQFEDGNQSSEISTSDQIFKAYQYKPLIIAYRNNNPVRLSDVAEVKDSVEDLRNAGLANGKPAVMVVVYKQPGANVIDTVDKLRNMIPILKSSIPAAIDMTVTLDRTTTIRASLKEVEKTLCISIVLVIFVVFIFLRNMRATIIPSVVVPLSLLGTFTIMYFLNFSLDNLSLMALTISTGFVVDDAIVVLENITRHIEDGKTPYHAAFLGTKEVGFTVVSMSLSLIAVFIPLLLMGGIVGRLFRQFAITLSLTILVSLVLSLTLTPMMCSRILKADKNNFSHNKKNSLHLDFLFTKLQAFYEKSLRVVLTHRKITLIITLCTVFLSIFLYIFVHKGFFPQQDTGRITASIQTDQNISFQSKQKKMADFIKIVQKDSAVQNVAGFVSGNNSGFIFISLKPLEVRKISATEVINRLRGKLAEVTGAVLYLQVAQDLVIGGRQGNSQFQYTISADNLEDLYEWTPKMVKELSQLKGIADVNSDLRDNGLQIAVNINRDEASSYGMSSQQIDNVLYGAFGQSQVSTLYEAMNQYHVIMEVAPPFWQSPDALQNIYLSSQMGTMVPLSTFSNFKLSPSLLSVSHQNQFPAVTLSFNLLPGFALGDIVNSIQNKVEQMPLPASLHASFQGTAKAFQDSLSNEPLLILAALVTMYIVLGILYENAVHPITILSTLPSAGVGALIALIITNIDLSLIAVVGILLLIGIVKKNAIMMIDFALHIQKTENKSSHEAIYKAATLRFRPIMMTTIAALLGAVPLAFGSGVGSELQKPLGISIIGGLIMSQILTLYTTPVIYLFLEKFFSKSNWVFLKNSKGRLKGSNAT